LQLINWRIYFL